MSDERKPDPHARLLLFRSDGEHMPHCNTSCDERGHFLTVAAVPVADPPKED